MKRITAILMLTALLSACTSGDEADEPADLLAPQREAMERAEGVEQVLDEAAQRQRRLIEEQGG